MCPVTQELRLQGRFPSVQVHNLGCLQLRRKPLLEKYGTKIVSHIFYLNHLEMS